MSVNFHPFFRELADRHVKLTVVLKNGVTLTGTLDFVDANLNMYLKEVESRVAQLQGVGTSFVRGSTVKSVEVAQEQVSDELLEDLLAREGIKSH